MHLFKMGACICSNQGCPQIIKSICVPIHKPKWPGILGILVHLWCEIYTECTLGKPINGPLTNSAHANSAQFRTQNQLGHLTNSAPLPTQPSYQLDPYLQANVSAFVLFVLFKYVLSVKGQKDHKIIK